MLQHIDEFHALDDQGKPAGGTSEGLGISIRWQDGPLGRGEDRLEPNGAFVEGVILAAAGRIAFYEDNGFGCPENLAALRYLKEAVACLEDRTARREAQGVEGTHEGS